MVWNKVSAQFTSVIDLTYILTQHKRNVCVIHITFQGSYTWVRWGWEL